MNTLYNVFLVQWTVKLVLSTVERRASCVTEVVNIWCDSVGKLEIYRQKNVMAFSPIFSESSSSETTGSIEIIKGVQIWTSSIFIQSLVDRHNSCNECGPEIRRRAYLL